MSLNENQDFYQYGGETGEQIKPPGGGALPPGAYKFSEEELRTLRQCNSESFFQRSLPLGTLFGLGTFSAVQRGRLKPNVRFGPYPKVALAVTVGYFLGKLSYQRACAEKLMALPNSYIGQLLREKRDASLNTSRRSMQPVPPMLGAKPDEIYSDAGPESSLDLDVDRPLFSDDGYRPIDSDGGGASPGGEDGAGGARGGGGGGVRSYDELRRLNRGEYSTARQDPYKLEPSSVPKVSRSRPTMEAPSTNKYGDIME